MTMNASYRVKFGTVSLILAAPVIISTFKSVANLRSLILILYVDIVNDAGVSFNLAF